MYSVSCSVLGENVRIYHCSLTIVMATRRICLSIEIFAESWTGPTFSEMMKRLVKSG
jgi:hypothetical protein